MSAVDNAIDTRDRPELAVSAAIFRDGKVLLARRAREPAHGLFTLPGGRVEHGERLAEAVLREVREETVEMPLTEIVFDFYDKLKSQTRGYASFDYHPIGYRDSDIVNMDILLKQGRYFICADTPEPGTRLWQKAL